MEDTSMAINEVKDPKNDVISEIIDITVSGDSGSAVCDTMNQKYKNIKLMTVTPVKGEEGQFNVHIEIYDPNVWMAAPVGGFWPIRRKSKRSHTPTV